MKRDKFLTVFPNEYRALVLVRTLDILIRLPLIYRWENSDLAKYEDCTRIQIPRTAVAYECIDLFCSYSEFI